VLVATLVEADGPYYVGAGNGSTAFSAAQTDLQGASKARVQATAVRTSASIVYTAEFDTSTGNFEWLEVGSFDAAAAGTMLTRKVVALPTKTSSEAWTVNLEVVFAAA
jgi:hypothetical protein